MITPEQVEHAQIGLRASARRLQAEADALSMLVWLESENAALAARARENPRLAVLLQDATKMDTLTSLFQAGLTLTEALDEQPQGRRAKQPIN